MRKNFLKFLRYPFLGLTIGALGAWLFLSATGLYFEEEWGLAALFKLRGPIESPPSVVIINIDPASAKLLNLSDDPERWPRSYYARLINTINQYNPALVAFNIYFGDARSPEDDQLFAKSLSTHGNIILSSYLKQQSVNSYVFHNKFSFETVIDPIDLLSTVALASAPFPLPKNSSTVKQFWTYKPSAGDVATLPTVIFQSYVVKTLYRPIRQLLQKISHPLYKELPEDLPFSTERQKLWNIIEKIQAAFDNHPNLRKTFAKALIKADYPPEQTRLLQNWLAALNGAPSLYLNYYGPAGTITTIPLHQALAMSILDPRLFQNKIVLVGYSEEIEFEKNQDFYASFSAKNQNFSSVEIAATAVANLVDNRWLKTLSPILQAGLLLLWGILIVSLYRFLSYQNSNTLLIWLNLAYLLFAYYCFRQSNLWLPIAIPLLQSMVVMLIEAILHQHNTMKILNMIWRGKVPQTPEDIGKFDTLTYGICLATDAAQYTSLSENLSPQQLYNLMNDYYGQMFLQVEKHQGLVTDVIGDAMMAVWTQSRPTVTLRTRACKATLAIQKAIHDFNQTQPHQLPTRFGLHSGEIRLGNIGSKDHYEYRAIGDPVNTACRLEGLNKLLGTEILASAMVVEGLHEIDKRELGTFILKGKTRPLELYELFDASKSYSAELLNEFEIALELFKNGEWQEAQQAFQTLRNHYPADGPTRFYVSYLASHLNSLDNDDDPIFPVAIHTGNITT